MLRGAALCRTLKHDPMIEQQEDAVSLSAPPPLMMSVAGLACLAGGCRLGQQPVQFRACLGRMP